MPGFLAAIWAWLFLLTIPLVIFYFLKLKRPHLAVPSLVLWQQVLQDSRVNSPFQRFKRNILLLLQLLLLLLLILAAMQPFFHGDAERAQRLPILIDCSASMGAYDTQGGQTRLAAAKQRVRDIIDTMPPDQRICLVSFSSTARKLTGFTDNKRVLLDAVDDIELHDVPADLSDALRLVTALSRREPFNRAMLLSDGNFPSDTGVDLAFKLDYEKLDPGGANMGVTALSAKRNPGNTDQWDVFARIEANSEQPMTATVELLEGDDVVATEDIALTAARGQRLMFPITTGEAANLELRLKPDGFDALAGDNIAYLDLETPRPLRVWCSFELNTYRMALRTQKDVSLYPIEGEPESGGLDFDLILTDQTDLQGRTAPVVMHVGITPESVSDLLVTDQEATPVIDWRRTDPLLEHVQLADVIILDNPISNERVAEQDYENRGHEVIAHGRQGPLVLRTRRGEGVTYHLLFHTDKSDLPYRIGFPIMVRNLVQLAMDNAGLSETVAATTGTLPAMRLAAQQQYTVKGPGGETIDKLTADERGDVPAASALRAGRYQLLRGGDVSASVGVSLLSSSETSLSTAEQIQFGELSVAATGQQVKTDRSLWQWFALAALVMLGAEWWYYQRKPGGFE